MGAGNGELVEEMLLQDNVHLDVSMRWVFLSLVLLAGAVFERPWPVLAYVTVVGFPLWFFVGYFFYYIYVCITSEIKVEAYVPITVAIFLGKRMTNLER